MLLRKMILSQFPRGTFTLTVWTQDAASNVIIVSFEISVVVECLLTVAALQRIIFLLDTVVALHVFSRARLSAI